MKVYTTINTKPSQDRLYLQKIICNLDAHFRGVSNRIIPIPPIKGKDIILYEAPSAQVFEVKTEGVICLSTRGYGWNEEENIVTLTLSVGFNEDESTKAVV